MTFSLIARCAQTKQFGMVVASSSPAVAARCAHVRSGVGAVASQNVTDPALGPLLLDAMAAGDGAAAAMARVTAGRPHIDYRQLMVIDRIGATATYMGDRVLGHWGVKTGLDCAASGNMLDNERVPAAMVEAFGEARGELADRLLLALEAGLRAGGEAGPIHSAGLKVADRLGWPSVDLRCDWSDRPVEDLRAIWAVYRPQVAAYVQRAENPAAAPSYGVPGDA